MSKSADGMRSYNTGKQLCSSHTCVQYMAEHRSKPEYSNRSYSLQAKWTKNIIDVKSHLHPSSQHSATINMVIMRAG